MLQGIRNSSELDLPINRDIAFIDHKGRHKPRLEKAQLKLLGRAAPLLKKILEPDEQILLITPGCTPYSVLEFLTTGWLIVYLKRCLLVATDRRLLHLPTRTNFAPKMSISQILYADAIELKVSSGLGRKLAVTHRDGSKESFTGFPGWAAKKLKVILQERRGHGRASLAPRRQYLCPQCTGVIAAASADCAICGLAFKNKQQALKYSLLYPGGGYFYTGHPWLGVGDALAEGFLMLMVVFGLFFALGPEGDLTFLSVVAVWGVILVLEKLVTVYHAQHYVAERVPADRNFSLS